MTKPQTSFKCDSCGNSSLVKSNFRGSQSGKYFCKSVKRPACEDARVYENGFDRHMKPSYPSFSPIEGWK